jgi:hypothetical protein
MPSFLPVRSIPPWRSLSGTGAEAGAAPFAEPEKVDLNFAEVVLKDGRIETLEESTVPLAGGDKSRACVRDAL